eukprot:CAMPEP_0115857634 /NCGR_PEP_ID=MMETSP0287-20121206/15678_1 /TAXON_ID=412157 /ORGANISM="Chrysochromulina rotalis, Strain UIO044" /LENGTH=240 /DNA_ID=CAMNT_0003311863 /DNA_START=32 /DNA_END=755 /DNA_ORIENTATION=-
MPTEDTKLALLRGELAPPPANMYWTAPFMQQVNDPIRPLQTLVIATGTHLWKQHFYPAVLNGCSTPNGMAEAFQPFKSLGYGTGDYGCDVFELRYPVMVANIARFIGNSRFKGHVVFVTAPPGTPGCASVASPLAPQPGAPTPPLTRASGAAYYHNRTRHAEVVWKTAFQKWAPHVKLSILNVTHVSETRADALIPQAVGPYSPSSVYPGEECEHFCLPGMPHVWSEMLLRLLEQYHFHN